MRRERREKVLSALEENGWRIHEDHRGEYWATHPWQPALSLAIGAAGSIRWRGRNLPASLRPRAGTHRASPEALNAARVYDGNASTDPARQQTDEAPRERREPHSEYRKPRSR